MLGSLEVEKIKLILWIKEANIGLYPITNNQLNFKGLSTATSFSFVRVVKNKFW
jgi:hypothetical protein